MWRRGRDVVVAGLAIRLGSASSEGVTVYGWRNFYCVWWEVEHCIRNLWESLPTWHGMIGFEVQNNTPKRNSS